MTFETVMLIVVCVLVVWAMRDEIFDRDDRVIRSDLIAQRHSTCEVLELPLAPGCGWEEHDVLTTLAEIASL